MQLGGMAKKHGLHAPLLAAAARTCSSVQISPGRELAGVPVSSMTRRASCGQATAQHGMMDACLPIHSQQYVTRDVDVLGPYTAIACTRMCMCACGRDSCRALDPLVLHVLALHVTACGCIHIHGHRPSIPHRTAPHLHERIGRLRAHRLVVFDGVRLVKHHHRRLEGRGHVARQVVAHDAVQRALAAHLPHTAPAPAQCKHPLRAGLTLSVRCLQLVLRLLLLPARPVCA